MIEWLANNILTVIVAAVLFIIIGIAVFSVVRDKKKKKGVCTCNCATCGMCCSCANKDTGK